MSNRITIGRYYGASSFIHNMNCIIKILCVLIYVCFCFISYDLCVNIAMLILVVLLTLLSRINILSYIKPIWEMKWLLLSIFIINLIVGNNLCDTGIMIVKIILLLIYTMMVTYTTKQNDMIYGLQVIFSPLKILKIPINKMAFSVSLAIRFVPELLDTYNCLLKIQKNRGVLATKLCFTDRLNLLKETIFSIFLISLRKSDELSDVMEIRLYDFEKPIYHSKLKICFFDIFILIIHIALLFLIIRRG